MSASVPLEFVTGSDRVCHVVEILQDDDCELTPENFFADLTIVSGRPIINIEPMNTQIFIDDANETDCGM